MRNDVKHEENVLFSVAMGLIAGWMGFIWHLGLLW